MKVVLWVNKRNVSKEEIESLKKLAHDEIQVKWIDRRIGDPFEILEELGDCEILAVTLPPYILSKIFRQIPKRVMVVIPRSKKTDGGVYQHIGFEVIERCDFVSYFIK